MNQIKPNDPETALDLCALAAIRDSRLKFANRLVELSSSADEAVVTSLRSDPTYQIAEFYYLLSAFGIATAADLDAMIERHNAYIASLLDDRPKASRMGLTRERLLASIFDGETKPRVLEIWERYPGSLDQSSLARLLVALMSDETARKTIVACDKAGLLVRRNSAFRTMLVQSTGALEKVYAECLRATRQAIADGALRINTKPVSEPSTRSPSAPKRSSRRTTAG